MGFEKIKVTPEGRDGIWLVEKNDLKMFLKTKDLQYVHNFPITSSTVFVGADHKIDSVMDDIDRAERVALLTGEAKQNNLNHALSLVIDNRLEIFDIGELTEDDLVIDLNKPLGKQATK